ncbi:putative Alkaline phosphatase D [Glarea lozoyensis 74030]|uniref:Putative Alkaline phosphatase D n=1 Tax=Glarea lozoyensis (strain ATCC 74030 / MF5533) TaxID=1104152 RepID=H0EPJ5_GLAL7|nr:putative Alkaline phosphatase D [Glarea lozoyensis 74030]
MREVIDSIPGGPQFMLFLGDFIYIDVPKRFGVTTEDYRREYRQVYSSPDWPLVGQNLSWIHVIDDHEIANDWDGNITGVYTAATDPWHNYQTSVNPPKAHQAGRFNTLREDATYFEFTQGPATFFMMDTRTYRDPSNELPVDSPDKSMMGADQLADLLAFLAKPEPKGVKWKIVVSSIPFTKNWRYLHERRIILEAMWDVGLRGGVGVVVLSGDRHEFAATAFPPPAGDNPEIAQMFIEKKVRLTTDLIITINITHQIVDLLITHILPQGTQQLPQLLGSYSFHALARSASESSSSAAAVGAGWRERPPVIMEMNSGIVHGGWWTDDWVGVLKHAPEDQCHASVRWLRQNLTSLTPQAAAKRL